MATISILVQSGHLISIGGGLEAHEPPLRRLYGYPHVIDWLDNVLPHLQPALDAGRQSPLEQIETLLYDFVSGDNFAFYEKSHSMLPTTNGIWELKTSDVRVFGWFVARSVFIIAEVDGAAKIKANSLYTGYMNSALHRRSTLNLDQPKFIVGDYSDVL